MYDSDGDPLHVFMRIVDTDKSIQDLRIPVQQAIEAELQEYPQDYLNTLNLDKVLDIAIADLQSLGHLRDWWCYDPNIRHVYNLTELLND